MILCAASWLIPLLQVEVASRETARALREGFGGGNGQSNPYVLAYLLGVGALVLIVALIAHRLLRGPMSGAEKSRDDLALAVAALGLTKDEHADLTRLAAAAQVATPVSMMLSPQVFAATLAATELPAKEPELVERLEHVATALFDDAQ